MPPIPLLPNQPTGTPDWFSPSGVSATQASSAGGYGSPYSSSSPNLVDTQSGPVSLPSEWDQATTSKWVDSYNKYIGNLTTAWQASSGLERQQIEAQIANAKQAQANAMKIANLQAETSRYGIDATRQTAMDQLQENQRQFNSNHDLAMRQYGLSVADTYTKYASTPDMMWSLNDFKDAMGRVGQGLTPTAISANSRIGTPQPKTWDDFAVLSGYNANGAPGTPQAPGGASAAPGATGASTDSIGGGPGSAGSTTDPRTSAITATMKALPPSDGQGHDSQDWAALQNISNLYFSGAPGSVERLGPARQKIAESGLARLGIDPGLATADYKQRGLGSGNPLAA